MSGPARSLYSVPGPTSPDTPPGDGGWELPLPLSTSRVLPAFPVGALPGWVADQVAAVAEATQTPPDLAGCIALAALSTAAGGRAVVQVRPGWVEPVNLYTVVVMEPSARKSPVFTAMVRPIYALERALREEAKESIETANVRRRAAEAASERAQKTAAGVDNKADDADREAAIADAVEAALSAAAIAIPVEPKLVVDDITPEAVGSVLAEQGGRLAILSDEGGIFAIIAGRYSGSANTNVFLKAYTGTQHRVDRTGRRSELVERPALTMGLTVQPAVIDDLGNTAMLRGSGFLARVLYSQPASLVGYRKARPNPVPRPVEETYNQQLHTIAYTLHGWADDPAHFVFSPAADDLMAELQDDVETRLHPHTGDWAHIGDWGGKAAGQTARLAGLLHTAHNPDNPWERPITGDTFTAAWELIDYYGAHALHIFDQIGADTDLDTARRLLDWLARTQPARFSKRDAFNAVRNNKTVQKVTDLDTALELLTDHGHIQRQLQPERPKGQRGRAPSPTYWTHPTYRHTSGTEEGKGTP